MTDEQITQELEQEPQPEPEVEEPSRIELAGRRFTPEELEPYVRVVDWARSDPQRWEQILNWERRGYVDDQQPQQRLQEEEYEEDDPYLIKYRELEERQQQLEQHILERQDYEDRTAIDSGLDLFKQKHTDLTEDDIETVLRTARDYHLVPSAIERNPARRDQAVSDAFEAAYRISYFNHAGRDASGKVVQDIRSRRRAASVGGTSKSAARTAPEPQTQAERDVAMAKEIAEAMSGE